MGKILIKIARVVLIVFAWLGMANSVIQLFLLATVGLPEDPSELVAGVVIFAISLIILVKTNQLRFIKRKIKSNS